MVKTVVKRSRSNRAETWMEPSHIEKIIRKEMPKKSQLGSKVGIFLAKACDELASSILMDAKELSEELKRKRITVNDIARCLADSTKDYYGIVPCGIANVNVLVGQRQDE